jgi:hypothetical protein
MGDKLDVHSELSSDIVQPDPRLQRPGAWDSWNCVAGKFR